MNILYLFHCFDNEEMTTNEEVQTMKKKSILVYLCLFISADNAAWAHKQSKNSCAKNSSQRGRGLTVCENKAIEYCQDYFQSDTTCMER